MQNLTTASSGRVKAGRLLFLCFVLLCIFNLALPKAGIKVGAIPVTFGYLALGLVGIAALLSMPFKKGPNSVALAQFVLGFLPLGILALVKATSPDASLTGAVVAAVVFLVLPAVILVFLSRHLEGISDEDFRRVYVNCLRFAVAWGLFNFFWYIATKNNVEIPYLTVNADEARSVFSKNNRRGGLMKLVSTYNNGNVFGACALMLGPLYLMMERSKVWRALYVFAIVLTLSRTAWFGLIGMFLCLRAFSLVRFNRASMWAMIAGGIVVMAAAMREMSWGASDLADSTIGGRLDTFDSFRLTLLGADRISIPELTYVGLLNSFGVVGFLFVLFALFLPAVYGFAKRNEITTMQKAAAAGALTYLILAVVDGAFVFPPVIALFLFMSVMVYRRPPG